MKIVEAKQEFTITFSSEDIKFLEYNLGIAAQYHIDMAVANEKMLGVDAHGSTTGIYQQNINRCFESYNKVLSMMNQLPRLY